MMTLDSQPEVCAACDHGIGWHFQSVDGKVRCLHQHEHTSTGVIMTYTVHCDCVDYASPATEERKRLQQEADRRQQEIFDEAFAPFKEKFAKEIKEATDGR